MRPVREMILPEARLAVISPKTMGSIRKPDSVGEAPRTICMYSGSSMMPPNMAIPTTTLAEIVTDAARLRNIRNGISAASAMARSAR